MTSKRCRGIGIACMMMADRLRRDPRLAPGGSPGRGSAYPSHFLSSGIAYAFHPHRDTWYSAPMCQINWWLPIYTIDPDNTMGFYPSYFDAPVKNNSEIYNYYEWNSKNRASAAQHVKSDTREQPKPQQELNERSLRYLPPPGGIIAFSGAQLHETVPNTTGVARYSIDFRTVHLDDIVARLGAVNIAPAPPCGTIPAPPTRAASCPKRSSASTTTERQRRTRYCASATGWPRRNSHVPHEAGTACINKAAPGRCSVCTDPCPAMKTADLLHQVIEGSGSGPEGVGRSGAAATPVRHPPAT
jgi:hypothetical protein